MLDLTNIGGINVALIGGIIGILFTLRRLDGGKRFGKKFYVLAVVILGFIAGVIVTEKWIWNFMLTSGIIHAGVASIAYQTGKLMLPGEEKFFHKRERRVK